GVGAGIGALVDRDRKRPERRRGAHPRLAEILTDAGVQRRTEQACYIDVRKARVEIHPHVVWDWNRIAQAIDDVELILPLPKFGCTVQLENQRIGCWTFQDSVVDTRNRIGADGERERGGGRKRQRGRRRRARAYSTILES